MKAKILKVLAVLGCLALSAGLAACGEEVPAQSVTDSEGGFKYRINKYSDGYILTEYTGYESEVVIPSVCNDLPVVGIAEKAFIDEQYVTEIVIPDTVTEIGNSAFANCASLTEVVVPDGVKTIGAQAFENCPSLTTVVLPDSVESIGNAAFANSNQLQYTVVSDLKYLGNTNNPYLYLADTKTTDITTAPIESSCKFIGYSAFEACTDLSEVAVPDGVKVIGDRAFYGCANVAEVSLPDSVTTIGADAFNGCATVSEFFIPEGVTSIGALAFYGCSGLDGITVEENNTAYKSVGGNLYTKDGSKLIKYIAEADETSFTVPDGVTVIGQYSFYGYTNLTEINLPDGLKTIGQYSFYGCTGLTSVEIPDSVTGIGLRAFAACGNIKEVVIPESVAIMVEGAFDANKDLVIYCETKSPLTDWEVRWNSANYPVVWNYAATKGVTEDGYIWGLMKDDTVSVAKYVGTATEVTIPETIAGYAVSAISNSAFAGRNDVTQIKFHDSITSIGERAFIDCNAIAEIELPLNLKSISAFTFYGCSKLETIVVPDSVASIGASAFIGCDNLSDVKISKSVIDIAQNAFQGCAKLKEFNVNAENIKYKSIDGNLYTTDGKTLVMYASGKTETTFTIPDGVTTVRENAFYGSTNLKEVVIPASVISIGKNAFYGCTQLEKIDVNAENIIYKSIDGNLYTRDEKTLITYASGKTESSFTIPKKVRTVSENAFYGCTKLTVVRTGADILVIEKNAFYGCTNLTIYTEETKKPVGWDTNWNSSNCTVYWYSKNEPKLNEDGTAYNGNFWHDVDGEIVVWEYQGE